MIIEYKKETKETKYFEQQVKCTKYKSQRWLDKISFKAL